LLQDERRQDALIVRRFNAELYPDAPLVWNSLADTYLAISDTTQAIANYRRAVLLDATSEHAAEMLRRLGQSRPIRSRP
jgi:tetratricopeptide (TPR) repeat protein